MTSTRFLEVAVVVAVVLTLGRERASAAPLKEQGLTALIVSGFEDGEITAKIKKDGIAFEVNKELIQRLKQKGASDTVLEAVQSAKQSGAADSASPLIAFDAIVSLLDSGVESDMIVTRLQKSAATYTLSPAQEKQLRDVGATDALIAAMKEGAKAATTPEPISDLVIVLDVSASMNEQTADGRTKLQVAKVVVSELVRKIPTGLNVSVVVYGYAPGCSAVKVLRSLAELKVTDREPLVAQLERLQALGNTPIALSLRQAGAQFLGRKTYCGIVLVTDGLESCNGDPSAEAAKLAENPMLRFGVNVVGFGLKPGEQAATAAIAKQGKGNYYDAQDRAALVAAIDEVTKKLEQNAKPAPLNEATPTGRRAVVVVAPTVKMPQVKAIVTVSEQASYYTVNSYAINRVSSYDAELRQPSDKPIGIWWVGEAGIPVEMIGAFENPERKVVKLRPEDYLGIVRVTSEAQADDVRVVVTKSKTSAGTVDSYKVQESNGYNQDMVVPVGNYMLWIAPKGGTPTLLEEDVKVAGGQVSAYEN